MINSIITEEVVKTILGKRDREIHKGHCGRILIAAGSRGMAGAAVLAVSGALRAGSGLVQAAVPAELFPILQTAVPEATCIERDFSKTDLGRYDAIAIGPGLGKSPEACASIEELLTAFNGPLVLDADALNIISEREWHSMLMKRPEGKTVITPHPGEAARLLGRNIGTTDEERREAAHALAERTGAVVLLKGHETIVAADSCKTYTNITGNPGMATGGSGDVLTGIIAGFMGQKKPVSLGGCRLSPREAAICGAFVHGRAGDLAADKLGEYGLIAGDIAYYTAIALKEISG